MDDVLHRLLQARGGIVTTAVAERFGVSSTDLRRWCAAGLVVRVARGGYVDGALFRSSDDAGRHCLVARTVVALVGSGVALSHYSAGAVLGLPNLAPYPSRVQLTRTGGGPHRTASAYTVHERYPEMSVSTTLPRVVGVPHVLLGIAATHGLEAVVVAGDHALRQRMTDPAALARTVETCTGRLGARVLRAAIPRLDARSESPGESRTRLVLDQLGVAYQSQVEVTGPDGQRARADFELEGGVLLEFDGLVKYGATARGPGDRAALVAEKVREDWLRALGHEIVRLTWTDLEKPAHIADLISAAYRRAVSRRPRTSARTL